MITKNIDNSVIDEEIYQPQQQKNESAREAQIKPTSLMTFHGQTRLRDNINVCIQSSRNRGAVLDHILFFGPPGLGKTTLASLVASEMKSTFRPVMAPVLKKIGDLAACLTQLKTGDVLFLDEIHALSRPIEEILYGAMENFSLDIIMGKDIHARPIKLELPRFTLIGATTMMGSLSAPLRDRFVIQEELIFYSETEMKILLSQAIDTMNMEISEEDLGLLSQRSRGTPRIGLRLLYRLRDFVWTHKVQLKQGKIIVTAETIQTMLHALGIDQYGLSPLDQRYIAYLFKNKEPVGLSTLSVALSQSTQTIESSIEPFLIQMNWVHKTSRGRCLTDYALGILSEHKG